MQAVIDQFHDNIGYVRHLGALYAALSAQTTEVLDLSDILRAQLVMGVSALDYYVHEVVRRGMMDVYQGKRSETTAFLNFPIKLNSVRQASADPNDMIWLETEIRTNLGYRSFQQADKIAEAIHLISDVKLWGEVAQRLSQDAENVKGQLKLIVNRRNQIAHEADLDPTVPGNRWPIDAPLVNDSINFIEQVVESIHGIVF